MNEQKGKTTFIGFCDFIFMYKFSIEAFPQIIFDLIFQGKEGPILLIHVAKRPIFKKYN